MSRYLRMLCPVLLCLVVVPFASAREWLAVGAEFPRLFGQTQDGRFIGLGPDVLREVAQRMGDSVRFEVYPWARAQKMVAQGRADILIGPYRTPEREQHFLFSQHAFYRDRIVFYARDGVDVDWRGDYAMLAGRRVGIIRGWTYGPHFDEGREAMDLHSIESVDNALRMLVLGRIDLLASNERNTRPRIEALERGTVHQLLPIIDIQDGYFAFPRTEDHAALRADFDRAFASLISDGRLDEMATRHGVTIP
ncbi:transporter substrate-binding domain-containing protein [Pseudomonas solani]|uniref:substrate-binding periplasmic protein n=1 Tax=Pseudomonas solani TaxID=2731552 RepID=UPI0035BE3BF3